MYIIVTKNEEMVKKARENGDITLKIPAEAINDFQKEEQAKITQKNDDAALKTDDQVVEKQKKEEAKSSVLYDFLKSSGIPAHIKGYSYLKFILQHCLENPGFEDLSVTKIIYPTCAKKFNTTTSRVERAVRHAIESGFKPEYMDTYIKLFGNISKEPSNSLFIRTAVIYINEFLI